MPCMDGMGKAFHLLGFHSQVPWQLERERERVKRPDLVVQLHWIWNVYIFAFFRTQISLDGCWFRHSQPYLIVSTPKKKHSQLQKVALSNMEKYYMFNLKALTQTSQEHNGIWLTSTSTFKANSWRFLRPVVHRNSWEFHSWENVMWRAKVLERLYDFGSLDAFHMSPYEYRNE